MANARAMARAGAAVVIAEKDFSAENLAGTLMGLFQDRPRLTAMGLKARALARPNAARDLAKLVLDVERVR
jgi:UDP-N-acetylglucosamine--N-acetylmuramyl-(pentapeptide) pyrophosphoryl-undecaprenol N-acetylglucosamine transferase